LCLDTTQAAFIPILKNILNLSDTLFLSIPNADLSRLIQELAWMRDALPTVALVPYFTHMGTLYYFPSPDFDNGKAFDFALADEYYLAYAENQDDTDALLLLASTLVKTNPTIPNTKEIVSNRLESFKTLPLEVIVVALRYFEALKKEIFDIGENVGLFEIETETDTEGVDESIHFGWWTSYRYIAKSQVFGDFEKVCNTPFWDVFKYLIEEKQRENALRRLYNTDPPA
jgi:hypothetical protein